MEEGAKNLGNTMATVVSTRAQINKSDAASHLDEVRSEEPKKKGKYIMNEDKIKDAIVPIYCDGDFRGTGFIYKHYLITAEHVLRAYEGAYKTINGLCVKVARIVQEYNDIEYKYNGTFYPFNYSDVVYSNKQYGDGGVFDFIDEDLAIYNLSEDIDILTMHEKDDVNGICASLYGFHCYNNNDIRIQTRELQLSYTHMCMGVHRITQDKCCYGTAIRNGDGIIEGYSGGPVLNGNDIVRMLVGHLPNSESYHMIKSSHILRQILKHEQNINKD